MTTVSRTFRLPATVSGSRQKYLKSAAKAARSRKTFLANLDQFVRQAALPLLARTFDASHYADRLREILSELGLSIDRLILVTYERLAEAGLPPGGEDIHPHERKFETPTLERDHRFVIQHRIFLGLTSSDNDCFLSIEGKDPDHIVGFLADSLLNTGVKQAMRHWRSLSRP
jgi:hypothetical protein